ncbi:IPT/TIG domain-containing protein [Mariniflexile jejuense]
MTKTNQSFYQKLMFYLKYLKEKSFFLNFVFFSLKLISVTYLVFIYSCDKSSDSINEEEAINDPVLKIDNVLPNKADLGDTLSIVGRNFKRSVILYLDETKLDIVFNNDSLVKFKVPYDGFNPFDFKIKIDNGEGVDKMEVLVSPFQLFTPIVDSIPVNFKYGKEVVVYGKHLTNSPSKKTDIISLNNEKITVTSHSKDSISFKLPYNLQSFDHDILIKAQLQELKILKGVKIPKPTITGLSKNKVKVGDDIMIYLSNFFPDITGLNDFYLADNKVEITERYRDSLLVKIPLGPYKSRDIGSLKIKLLNTDIENKIDLNLISKWYLWSYKRDYELTGGLASVGNLTLSSFYDNNMAYINVFKNSSGTENNAIFKYTPENNKWEESIIPISTEGIFGHLFYFFPLNNGVHTYLYIKRKTNNFYKYNFQTNTVTQLQDFINNELIQQPTGFVHNGELYFGLGYTGSTSLYQNRKIWKYRENSNSWEQITEIPLVNNYDLRNAPSVFKSNGKFYIGNGEERTTNFWEFTPDNTWVRKSDITKPVQRAINVQVDDRGFYYNNYLKNFWEYDIGSNQWFERNDLKAEGYNFGPEYMFIHNNYVYLIGYQNGYPPSNTLFSNHDHIILRTELYNF